MNDSTCEALTTRGNHCIRSAIVSVADVDLCDLHRYQLGLHQKLKLWSAITADRWIHSTPAGYVITNTPNPAT